MATRNLSFLFMLIAAIVLAHQPVFAADPSNDPVIKTKTGDEKVEVSPKDKKSTEHLNKEDRDTINAVNQIPGVEVDPEQFQAKKKKGFSVPNPVGWLFKPVTDMQKRVVHLEQQIMRLEGPIAGLQKPMNGLRGQMVNVQGNMGTLNNGMGKLDTNMGRLQGNMSSIENKMNKVDSRLARMEHELQRIYDPIYGLKQPIQNLQQPLNGVGGQLSVLKRDLAELKNVVNVTSTLILVAIVSIGLLVVLGTPIVAVFAWRYRNKIIQKVEGPAATSKIKEHAASV